jgi:predicted NBD/HSP70 family sugar kinase
MGARSAILAVPSGPPSETQFIRALGTWALQSVDLFNNDPVVGLTPTELEAHSGLSRPSVSGLIKRFEPILEAQNLDGEPVAVEDARRWALAPRSGIVIGIEIAEDRALVVKSDMYGRITDEVALGEGRGAEEIVDEAVDAIRRFVGHRASNDVVGVGVGVAAPVEQGRGVAWAVPDEAWGDWQLTHMRQHLRSRLHWDHLPCRLDNDANLSALSEFFWGAARPSRIGDHARYQNVLYIEWSRGVGAGLILSGELYRGGGLAGEVGHTVICEGDDAQLCKRCGNTGCLETVIGWDSLLRRLVDFENDQVVILEEDLKRALRRANDPATHEAKLFASAAMRLGSVLGPLINVLNPELVILGGDVGNWGYDVVRPWLMESLKRHTMRSALAEVTIVAGRLGDRATRCGAVALVLEPVGEFDALLAFAQRH